MAFCFATIQRASEATDSGGMALFVTPFCMAARDRLRSTLQALDAGT